jgi:hypothetical protein
LAEKLERRWNGVATRLITGAPGKDPKATAIGGGSELIAPFDFRIGQDKVLSRIRRRPVELADACVYDYVGQASRRFRRLRPANYQVFSFEPVEGW